MERTLPRFLWYVTMGGMLGLVLELLLLAHTEDLLQWIPLILLGLGLAGLVLAGARPTPARLRAVQVAMATLLVAGVAGVVLHFLGNRAFQLEIDPTLHGWALAWKVIRAHSPPALAPGALVLVGLVGIGWTVAVPPAPR